MQRLFNVQEAETQGSWTRKSSGESAMGSRVRGLQRYLNCCQSSYVLQSMSQPVAGLARVQRIAMGSRG